MLRHMFESIYRFAYFLPMQVEAARAAGLKSPAALSLNVMKLQAMAIGSAYKVDQWSAPTGQRHSFTMFGITKTIG